MTEDRDGVDGEPQHLVERVLGGAREPLLPLVLDGLLPEADPGGEATHEAVMLPHPDEGVDHSPVEQAEVTCVVWNVDSREPADEAVENRSGEELEACLADSM